jgi:hypothetical protein
MAINSRTDLKNYCLRKLGAPVLEINVADDQAEDRIDEALQFYQEYHSDAIERTYTKYQITSSDVSNGYITIPDSLTVVKRVLPLTSESGSGGMFSANYQMALNDAYLLHGGNLTGSLAYYSQTQSYMTMINSMFNGSSVATRFSRHQDRLHIDLEWGVDLKADDWIIIEGSTIINPETYTDVYDDMFLKRYTTALIKLQWGTNLSKFEGMQLPGGVQFSGRQMIEDAKEEILKIEEEMQLRYEEPADFFMG